MTAKRRPKTPANPISKLIRFIREDGRLDASVESFKAAHIAAAVGTAFYIGAAVVVMRGSPRARRERPTRIRKSSSDLAQNLLRGNRPQVDSAAVDNLLLVRLRRAVL